jgi:hypothetical protein
LFFLPGLLYAQDLVNPTAVNLKFNQGQNTYSEIQLPFELVRSTVAPPKGEKAKAFLQFLNQKILNAKKRNNNKPDKDEKNILREKWKNLLGVDIFLPYFKAKEIEDWVGAKTTVKIYKIKGKPVLEDNQIKYIFKVKF